MHRPIAIFTFAGLGFSVLVALTSCNSFDTKVLNDQKSLAGQPFETNKIIQSSAPHFGDYTFVKQNSASSSTLKLFYRDKEIFLSKHSDGMFDTIIKANLNNDRIPDFLVVYSFEDGAMLFGLLSKTQTSFEEKQLSEEISSYYCGEIGDTSNYIQELTIADIDRDGKDEIIVNAVKMNGKLFGIACTDTIHADN